MKIGAGAGGIFGGLGGQASEGIVKPEVFGRFIFSSFSLVRFLSSRFLFSGFLEKFTKQDRGIAAITAQFDKIARLIEAALGETEELGGFGRGDLVIHE